MKSYIACQYPGRQIGAYDCSCESKKAYKIRCPGCGRKVKLKTFLDHEGHLFFSIPNHKVKSWWKLGEDGKKKRKKMGE